ncbi:MAG: oligosaccharide flippase family protein [Bacteroidales bacterium]|nr:oligosaccharide flippase family protein [Bacteroidales bacterium]
MNMTLHSRIKAFISSPNVRNGAIYTIFSFVNRGLSFVLLLLLAGYLTTNDYGLLNLFNTFATLVGILITLGTTSFVSIAFFRKSRQDLNKIIGFALFVTTVVLIIISIVLLLFPHQAQTISGIDLEYLFIALFVCYTTEVSNLNLLLWQLEEKPISYGVFTLVMAVCNFLLTIWFVIGLKMNWEGRAYSQLLVSSVLGVYSFWFIVKRKYISFSIFDKSLILEVFAYGLPLVPHMMSFWFKQGCDRYIIKYFWDASFVGVYSFALNFAAIIGMIGTAFNASNSVFMFKNLAQGYANRKQTLQKITRVMIGIYAVVFIVIWIGSAWGIPLFLPRYTDSIVLLLPVCLGAFAQCLYLLYVNYLFFYKKTRQLMYITFSTALLQFAVSIWLTRYSILYTAYTSMAISIITFLGVYLISSRTLHIQDQMTE